MQDIELDLLIVVVKILSFFVDFVFLFFAGFFFYFGYKAIKTKKYHGRMVDLSGNSAVVAGILCLLGGVILLFVWASFLVSTIFH